MIYEIPTIAIILAKGDGIAEGLSTTIAVIATSASAVIQSDATAIIHHAKLPVSRYVIVAGIQTAAAPRKTEESVDTDCLDFISRDENPIGADLNSTQ